VSERLVTLWLTCSTQSLELFSMRSFNVLPLNQFFPDVRTIDLRSVLQMTVEVQLAQCEQSIYHHSS
jgi:hypothetical protein